MTKRLALTELQALCLLCLTLHTSATSMIMHAGRHTAPSAQYSVATSVFLGEVGKMVLSNLLVYNEQQEAAHNQVHEKQRRCGLCVRMYQHVTGYFATLRDSICEREAIKLLIPAAFYVMQNMLQLIAVSHVSPMTYQALSQLKILAVATLSIWILKKTISARQWLSILLLLTGVILIQNQKNVVVVNPLSITPTGSIGVGVWHISKTRLHNFAHNVLYTNQNLAAFAVLISCFLGSTGGVYLEKLFKGQSKSLWVMNTQLSLFSLAPALVFLGYDCFKRQSLNIFHNFGFWAVCTVLIRSAGGMLVALVLKHCDNILKSFATSASIILTLSIESVAANKLPTLTFSLGAFCIVTSSVAYSLSQAKRAPRPTYIEIEEKQPDNLSYKDSPQYSPA